MSALSLAWNAPLEVCNTQMEGFLGVYVQKWPKTCSQRVLGGGMPPLSLWAPTFCSIYAILGKIKGPLEGGEASQPPKKNSLLLMTLLEHVFGAFFHINPLEPFHLGIAHFYRGISSQKSGCAQGCTRSLQNTIFTIFHLFGSYLGYHNIIPTCAFKFM